MDGVEEPPISAGFRAEPPPAKQGTAYLQSQYAVVAGLVRKRRMHFSPERHQPPLVPGAATSEVLRLRSVA